jgi:hypothetical protein
MAGYDRLQSRVPAEISAMLKKSIELDPADRYRTAAEMYTEFRKIRRQQKRKKNKAGTRNKSLVKNGAAWQKMQWREFQKQYKSELNTTHHCRRCDGPVAESMQACPWCGTDHPTRRSDTPMPAVCPRCERGVKKDWHYCAWCYGAGFELETARRFPDKRYTARCASHNCREPIMPFMRYCPWCRGKVKKGWKIGSTQHKCHSCNWGVATEFWNYCAWCSASVDK